MTLTPFDYEGQEVRVFDLDGEPWFAAVDVCGVLEVGNPTQALSRLDPDERTLISNEGREINAVSEPGLYALVLGSRKPQAKPFKRWVTHEVLPSIRKTGNYGTPRQLTDDELIHRALTVSVARVESLTARLAIVEPTGEEFAAHTVRITAKGAVALAVMLNVAPADLAEALTTLDEKAAA